MMKKKFIKTNKIWVAAAFLVALFSTSACSDEWNEHYDPAVTNNGTLWEAISNQNNLSNFTRVVKACGYDLTLNGTQVFTIFAPTDDVFSSEEADALIAEFQAQKNAGVKTADNSVVKQFLQNHISLYRYPVSSLTNDSITMMNGKYQVLTPTTFAGVNITSSNALCDNGVLFTIGDKAEYFPNVFEYLGSDNDLDSVYQFLNSYSVYEFNESKSVPGGIVDGQTVYLDSVSDLSNIMFTTLGKINAEDSTYWMIAPVNSEWTRMVNEYEKYFNYDKTVNRRDSLQYANARMGIVRGTVFSRTTNPDAAFQDSAVSTNAYTYSMRKMLGQDEAYYLYKKPFASGGVFDGTEDIVCSNGHVRKANTFNIDKYQTFMQTIKIEAEDVRRQDTIISAEEPLTVRTVATSNPFYDMLSGNSFAEVIPELSSSRPTVTFNIPNVLSNIPYDIYAVFAPALAYDTLATEEDRLPCLFRASIGYNDQNGKAQSKRLGTSYSTKADVVDSVLLYSGYVVPTCSYGLADPQVTIQIRSTVSDKQTSTYSRTLRIDCLIFKPHDEEATTESAKRNLNQ